MTMTASDWPTWFRYPLLGVRGGGTERGLRWPPPHTHTIKSGGGGGRGVPHFFRGKQGKINNKYREGETFSSLFEENVSGKELAHAPTYFFCVGI